MTPCPTERIALFIDGPSLYSAAKTLNADLDFSRLLEMYRAKGVLVRAYYYTAVIEGEEFSPIKPPAHLITPLIPANAGTRMASAGLRNSACPAGPIPSLE